MKKDFPPSPEQQKREIYFLGEEVPRLFNQNTKLVTIRMSDQKYQGFKVGEKINANCEGEIVPLIVWGVEENVSLKDIDPVLLAMDGFLSLDVTIEEMRTYPGRYQEIDEDSKMVAIAAMTEENFNGLGIEAQKVLLGQKERSLGEVVRDPRMGRLVKRSIAAWFCYRGRNVEDWLKFFKDNSLLSKERYDAVFRYHKQRVEKGDSVVFGDPEEADFLLRWKWRPGQEIYESLYKPFVLGEV